MTTTIHRSEALGDDLVLSVVIPTYNRVEMLVEAVEALQKQDFEGFEIIVVDNGPSTDGTGARVRAMMTEDPRIVLVETTEQGDFVARTIGCEAAVGAFVLTTDDDWEMLEAGSLRYIVETMRGDETIGVMGLAPDANLRYHGREGLAARLKGWFTRAIYRPGRISRWGWPKTRFHYLAMGELHEVDHVRGACLAFRRDVGEEVGFFPTLYNALCGGIGYRSETEFCVRVQQAGYRVVYSTEVLGRHKSGRRQKGSAPREKTAEVFRCQAMTNTLFFLRNYGGGLLFVLADVLVGNRGQPGLLYLLTPRAGSVGASLRGKLDGWRAWRTQPDVRV